MLRNNTRASRFGLVKNVPLLSVTVTLDTLRKELKYQQSHTPLNHTLHISDNLVLVRRARHCNTADYYYPIHMSGKIQTVRI